MIGNLDSLGIKPKHMIRVVILGSDSGFLVLLEDDRPACVMTLRVWCAKPGSNIPSG